MQPYKALEKKTQQWFFVTSLHWYRPDTGKTGLCGVTILTETNHDKFLSIEEVAELTN